ncbi:MAG: hypothetical protein ACYC1D_19740 [Acidimicrobiales bacterium]
MVAQVEIVRERPDGDVAVGLLRRYYDELTLYRSAGYSNISAYNDNPYAAHWLEKRIT